MNHPLLPMNFKFRYLDENGRETGFLNSKGSFDGDTLVLGEHAIPAAFIMQTHMRQKYLVLGVLGENGPVVLSLAINSGSAVQLKQAIDITRSRAQADFHKKKMVEEGRASDYREQLCQHCSATIVLANMPKTPQLYCDFCDTLTTVDSPESAPPKEHEFRICDECGLFSKPRLFTFLYFYFLLVVYGYSYRQAWRCPACMRNDAWTMLLANLLFVLGVPNALLQLWRSYGGGIGEPAFAGLDDANIQVKAGNVSAALPNYSAIIDRVPFCAGVKFNLGMGLIKQQDFEHARQTFEMSLDDCANYTPSFRGLMHCLETLEDHDAIAALKKQWGIEEEEHVMTAEVDDSESPHDNN
jgi:hypothetical protein